MGWTFHHQGKSCQTFQLWYEGTLFEQEQLYWVYYLKPLRPWGTQASRTNGHSIHSINLGKADYCALKKAIQNTAPLGAETHKDRTVLNLCESCQHSWGAWHLPSHFIREWLVESKMCSPSLEHQKKCTTWGEQKWKWLHIPMGRVDCFLYSSEGALSKNPTMIIKNKFLPLLQLS